MPTNSFATRRQSICKKKKKKTLFHHHRRGRQGNIRQFISSVKHRSLGTVAECPEDEPRTVTGERFYSSRACPREQTKGPETKDPCGHLPVRAPR